MTILDRALKLAEHGFYVFPCRVNGKKPAIDDFPNAATRDPAQIKRWFEGQNYNIGIYTGRYHDDQALVVIDVDNKNGKSGDKALMALELEGFELPPSLEQSTPSGGRHIVYASPYACKQGVNVLGEGLDIRSRGGYILGPGSVIDGKRYAQINGHGTIASAPDCLLNKLGRQAETKPQANIIIPNIDAKRAEKRAVAFLDELVQVIEGERNHAAFKAAATLKDLGCDEDTSFGLMVEKWNEKCNPPLEEEELRQCVSSAYRYGREPQGAKAPEALFPKVENDPDAPGTPCEELNREFAFVKRGAFVLQETTDQEGRFVTEHLGMAEFHGWFANRKLAVGNKRRPISQIWMEWEYRRQYEGVIFSPQKEHGPRWYNLWRGFTVKPADKAKHPAVELFLEHALENVCEGDEVLFKWLIAFFAHIVQRPWEKPLVALVFQGKKGVGKNALIERIAALLGVHALVANDDRFLLSNFNSHLENNLLFILDEASWAGDKRAEGKLKGLITGSEHNIERKGKEPYRVVNLTRVVIIGNEDWLVPATEDERRYAVFNVGDGRQQDRKFFTDMRVGMESGGYACLLRYLLDYDLTGFDLNEAPMTQGLVDQKHASLDPLKEWWLDCLELDQLVGSDWENNLPELTPTNRMLDAFTKWARGRNIRSRLPGRNLFYRELAAMAPSMPRVKTKPEEPEDHTYSFKNPGIETLRLDWDAFIGGKHTWSK